MTNDERFSYYNYASYIGITFNTSGDNDRVMDTLNKEKMWDGANLALLDSVITFMKCSGRECKTCKLKEKATSGLSLCDEIARLVYLITGVKNNE